MKKVSFILLALCLMCVVAYADQTGNGDWTYINSSYVDHTHSYVDEQYEPKAQLGLGVDITVYEFEGNPLSWGLESVEVQNKFDINNTEYAGFVVLQVNAWKPLKRVFGWK